MHLDIVCIGNSLDELLDKRNSILQRLFLLDKYLFETPFSFWDHNHTPDGKMHIIIHVDSDIQLPNDLGDIEYRPEEYSKISKSIQEREMQRE